MLSISTEISDLGLPGHYAYYAFCFKICASFGVCHENLNYCSIACLRVAAWLPCSV